MSKLREQSQETISRAKYKVKNAEGKYEVVYLETSADQVETTPEMQFVSQTEKDVFANKYTTTEVDSMFQEANAEAEGIASRVTKVEGGLTTEVTDRKAADNVLDGRLSTLERLVVGGEGEGLDAIITDVAETKAGLATEIERATKAEEKLASDIVASLTDSKSYTDGEVVKVNAKITEVQGLVNGLESEMGVAQSDIQTLKDAVANKNSNTLVYSTMDEFNAAAGELTAKIGDLVFVIDIKKAFIFKDKLSKSTMELPTPPTGWELFDEITTEVDLVNYLTKTDAEATYRKLANKIAESDLATELVTKINAKVEASYVDTKVEEIVAPVRVESAQNKVDIASNASAITKEVSDRKSEITRVEDVISNLETAINESIENVDTKVNDVALDLITKETDLKAEDTRLNNRISKFAPVVAKTEPVGTETGHVWLELV